MTFHTPFSWRVPKAFVIGTSESIAVAPAGCELLTGDAQTVVMK